MPEISRWARGFGGRSRGELTAAAVVARECRRRRAAAGRRGQRRWATAVEAREGHRRRVGRRLRRQGEGVAPTCARFDLVAQAGFTHTREPARLGHDRDVRCAREHAEQERKRDEGRHAATLSHIAIRPGRRALSALARLFPALASASPALWGMAVTIDGGLHRSASRFVYRCAVLQLTNLYTRTGSS